MYKTNFYSETFLRKLPTFLAINMLKFRCRNNKIPATLHGQNAMENPICTLCNSNTTDEFHVILKCSFYRDERKKFLGKHVFAPANIYTLARIMSTTNL